MTTSQDYLATLTLPNRTDSVRPALTFLIETSRALKIAAAARPHFEVAVTEALTNAVKHGHTGAEGEVIVCELEVTAGQLLIRIIDGGPGFTVRERHIPEITPEHVESLAESGYGLPIIQSVFPIVRTIRVNGRFGLELGLLLHGRPGV